MNTERLKEELKRDEGFRGLVYDCASGEPARGVGALTIGYGRNLQDVGITEDEAAELLNHDVNRAIADLITVVPQLMTLTDGRANALLNMVYNLGLTRFRGFKKMIAAVNQGEWDRAAEEAIDSRWARQVGERAMRIARAFKEG
jgi:lysozyme